MNVVTFNCEGIVINVTVEVTAHTGYHSAKLVTDLYFKSGAWVPENGNTKVGGHLDHCGRSLTDNNIILLEWKSYADVVDIYLRWQKSDDLSVRSGSNLEGDGSSTDCIRVVIIAEFVLHPDVEFWSTSGKGDGLGLLDKDVFALTGVVELMAIKRLVMWATHDDTTAVTIGWIARPFSSGYTSAFLTLSCVAGANWVSDTIQCSVTAVTANWCFNDWVYGHDGHDWIVRGAGGSGPTEGTTALIGGNTFASIHTRI